MNGKAGGHERVQTPSPLSFSFVASVRDVLVLRLSYLSSGSEAAYVYLKSRSTERRRPTLQFKSPVDILAFPFLRLRLRLHLLPLASLRVVSFSFAPSLSLSL